MQTAGHLELSKQSQLTNDGGHIVAQSLDIAADALSNQAGEVYAQQQLTSRLKTLDNSQGSLVGGLGVDLAVGGKLHNDGVLGGDGAVKLTAGALENGGGLIQAGKDLQLTASSLSNAEKGRVLALGKDAASLLDVSGELHNQGKIAGNADLTVKAASVDNAKGNLQTAGALNLTKQAALSNDGGHLAAQSLNIQTGSLSNQGGEIRQVGQGAATLQIGQDFNNQQGQVFSQGGLTLGAGQLDNSHGVLASQGAQQLRLQALNNQNGVLASGQALGLALSGAADNRQGQIQGDSLQLSGQSLDNRGGAVKALGADASRVSLSGMLDNSEKGALAVNGKLDLAAGQLNNQQGLLQSAALLNAQIEQDAQNRDGQLLAGQLSLSAASLGNQHGEIGQAGGELAKLDIRGQIDNSGQGKITANGQLQIHSGDLDNHQGVLSSQGDLTLRGGALNNRQGTLGSNGALAVTGASLDNSQGLLQAGQALQLDSGSLQNGGGKVLALGQGDSTLNVSGQLANGGQIAGNGNWQLNAQSLDNSGGSVYSQRNLAVNAATLANPGAMQAGQDLALTLQSDFVNSAGTQLQANRNLSISSSGNLFNNGELQTGGNLKLSGLNWTNNGNVNIGGALDTRLSQSLVNNGNLGAGALNLNAASLVNTASITAGDIAIHAGSLDNGGGKALLASAGNLALDVGGTLNNHDGAWLYSQGDMRIGQAGAKTGQVVNHVATLQSDGNMFIDAGRVSNESNSVAVTEESSYLDSSKVTYQIPQLVIRREVPLHDGMGHVFYENRSDVRSFDFSNGADVQYAEVRKSCNSDHCGNLSAIQNIKYQLVSDDEVGRFLTVRKEVSGGWNFNAAPVVSVENFYYVDHVASRYTYFPGFDPNKNLFPSVLPDDVKTISSAGFDVARVGEVSRATKTTIVIDKVNNEPVQAKLLAGGQVVVNAGEFVNQYSSVMVGGDLMVSSGGIKNVGQQLKKTTTVTAVSSVVQSINSVFDLRGCVTGGQPRCGTTSVALPATTSTEVIGSLDATVVTNQHLSLQAPTIANGKGAPRVDAATMQAALENIQVMFDRTPGSANAIDHAGQTQGAAQAVDAAAQPGKQALGVEAAAALANASPIRIYGQGELGGQYQPAPAHQQVTLQAGGAKAGNPVANGYAVPDNGLFHTQPAPQQPYLVETNPQFTQYKNFVSSDYLLKQLNYDPSKVEKRLGDGFYEQQLVSRAVTDLTGKRLLDGSRNAMEQYQQLMSNGAQYAKQFQLTPGMALSAEQMAKLTSDMVWLVKQNVGGQEVLVPMVYLANADQKSLRGQGAVLAGNSMSLQASGELINNGVLKADATLLAQAGAIRIEGGKVQAGGDLGLSARQNLTITDDAQHSQAGSSILAGGNLQLQAGGDLKLQAADARAGGNAWLQAGGDLDIGSRETSYSLGSGYGSFQYQQVDHVGSQLNIGGSLVLNAASDLTLSGSAVKAGGGILAAAGNNLALESTQDSKHGAGSWRGGAYDTLSQSHHAATLQGGDIALKAGGDLSLQGSSVQADGSLAAIAGKQLTLQSQVDTQRDSGYNWSGSHNWQTDNLAVAGLSSKGSLQANAGGDAVLNGASLSSDAKLALSAGNDIKLGAVATESRSDNDWGDTVRNNYDLTQHGSSLHGEAGLGLQAARDIRTQAASLASDGEAALLAGRDIYLGAADDAHSDYSKTVRSSGGFFKHKTTVDISAHQSTTQVGTNVSADTLRVQSGHDLNIVGSQLAGSGNVALQAGDNIDIAAGVNTSQSFQFHHEKTSGLFGLGGAGFMVGSKELTDALNANGVTQSQSKSLVGSLKGDLSVQAGQGLNVQGSSLSALGGNVDVGADSVAVGEGRDIMVVDHDHIEKQRGFSVTEVNTLKNTFDNLKDVIHTQRGFGLLKGLANEAAASTSSQQGVDIAYSRGEQGSHEHSRTVSSVGSAILAGGDIRLQASGKPADAAGSGDLTITGSRLQGGGKVDLFANGSVNLLAGLNQRQDDSSSYRYDSRVSMYNQQMGDVIRALEGGPSHNGTSLSPYNQLRAESVGSRQDQQLQASEIRGDQIRVVGLGGDVKVVGATLQGVHDVSVAASQGSVNVLGGTEHYQSSQDSHSLTFGNIGGGNHSATVGAQHSWDQLAANGSAQSGGFSRIESQQGNVALSAADAITVAGAALQAGQDLSLTGKSLQIAPGVDQDQHSETHRMNQRGITGAVSSPILAAADAVTSMAEVASNKNTDARTRALAAGTASLAAYNGYQSAKSVSDGQLISGSLTFGASKSESREEGKSLANAETSLTAGRDLILRASGGGKDSNIDIAGSRLQAGRNATLQADNQIQLVSAQDSSSLRGENDSSGWGAGIAVSFGKGGFSFGGTANANHSFGKENGSTIDQRDTTVSAGDTLTLKSGGDATLKGAEARGQTIVANVGGNLDIESLQDQHQYQSSSKSMAGSVTIGYGFSASANYSQQKMDNDYASVRQQSGLKAGDGGYQVAVKGNTNLAGAVIASSDRAVADDKNSLSTGTLTTSDVYNHARSSGSSVGLAVSGSMGGGGKDGDGKGGAASGSSSSSSSSSSSGAAAAAGNSAPASPSSGGNYSGAHVQQFGNGGSAGTSGVMASSQSAESVTRAGISGGKLAIADDAGQQALTGQSASQAAAAVNRGVSSDRDGANALQDKFDKQQLQTAFTVVQTFTDQISTFAANKAAEAKAAKDLADRAKTDPSLSDEQKAQLQAQADQAAKWAPGGRYSQILTAATAGISGNVGNSLSGMAQNAGIAYLQGLGAQQIKQMVDELEKGDKTVAGETVRAVLHGALACAGAEASSQSCAAGAIGGAASVALNNALDKAQDTNSDKMTAEEKQQRENLVSSLLAGASVAAGATDTAATTVNAAKTEMENNFFALPMTPPPVALPGKIPPIVDSSLDGKPNLASQIAGEVRGSLEGAGKAFNDPKAFGQFILEGMGIVDPIDPSSYSRSYGKDLSKGDIVDLSDFGQRQKQSGGGANYVDPKTGWSISPERSGNPHGGSAWKLFDAKGRRVATLDESGKVLRK
ncbi:hemagglutinin repeat-containing protein [Chromobacterium subtsugae]|uniref:hemagglutinin repeat-containing protein n=1 Tax=Chromobacterium subtsugae TaxID=251747 RepID=UPI001F319B07|nr:hemagglutinin repeat-containing protein [Chromobacterium subtsugae]